MGTAEVDVALRDGGHAELVVGPGEERGEGAGKHHVTVPHGTTHRHTHLTEEREREMIKSKYQFMQIIGL